MLTNTHSTTWYLLLYHNAHQHTLYYMVSTALSQCSPTHTLLHGIYCSITMLTNTHSTTWYLLLYHNAHQHTAQTETVTASCSRTECRTLDKLSGGEAAAFVRCNTACYRTVQVKLPRIATVTTLLPQLQCIQREPGGMVANLRV